MPLQQMPISPCPFCGGEGSVHRVTRMGYEHFLDDPDAYAYFVLCRSCAAQGGWAKSESGAIRNWNMYLKKEIPMSEKAQIVLVQYPKDFGSHLKLMVKIGDKFVLTDIDDVSIEYSPLTESIEVSFRLPKDRFIKPVNEGGS